MQQFDLITMPVDEDKYIPTAGIIFKVVLYQSGQTVKTLAHIGRLAEQVELIAG
jgi:hypothetical protein